MDLDDSSRTWSGRARDVQERVLVGALSAVPGRELHRLAEVAHPPPLPVVVVVVVVVIAAAAIAVGSRSSSRLLLLLLLLLLLPFRRGLRPSRARRTLVALGRDRIAIVVRSSRVGGGHDGALREPRSAPAVSTGRGDVSDSVPSSTDWERRRRRWWVGGGW
jgi:hypothetical protein